MSGGVEVETVVRLYCSGPAHNHTRLVLPWMIDEAGVARAISEAGWVMTEDSKVFCPLHRASARRVKVFAYPSMPPPDYMPPPRPPTVGPRGGAGDSGASDV